MQTEQFKQNDLVQIIVRNSYSGEGMHGGYRSFQIWRFDRIAGDKKNCMVYGTGKNAGLHYTVSLTEIVKISE